MSKRQLYALLGTPHFNEGMWGVHEWNYLFNFRTAQGAEYFTCQFQVRFDSKGIAQGGYWKPESCAAVIEPPRPPAPPAPAPLPEQPLRLSADALFGFDSAVLSAEGLQAVQGILAQVREAAQVQSIRVTGYTDRIGSASYNQTLSQRRAESVRVAFQQAWPSPLSASPPVALSQPPLDLKWLATTTNTGPRPARKACASGARLRSRKGPSASVAGRPTGVKRLAR